MDKLSDTIDYYAFRVWSEKGSPIGNDYPMMSTPWPSLAIVIGYFYFVKIAGPSMMKSKKAVDVKYMMIIYNITMIFVSAWMTIEAFLVTKFTYRAWSCQESQRIYYSSDPQDQLLNRRMFFVAYVFYFSKYIEFSDTVFMVLRKKNQQITKLHVIHHSTVPLSVWIALKFAPVFLNLWFPLLNSFVHTLMYSYYCLTSAQGFFSPSMRVKIQNFKPWITRVQIIQFILIILHCAFHTIVSMGINSCLVPKAYLVPNFLNAFLFLVLFTNLYLQSYVYKKIGAKKSDLTMDAYNNNGVIKKIHETATITPDSSTSSENYKRD